MNFGIPQKKRNILEGERLAASHKYLRSLRLCSFYHKFWFNTAVTFGPGSSVGIATGNGLDGPGIETRWGEISRTSPDRP